MLGGEGWSGGHRRAIPKLSHRDASHVLNDHARRSQAVAIGPRTADGARADRVYLRRRPSRRQLPSRFRPGSPWLRPTVGRSKRTAAVNRPARMNAQRGAFCSRTDGVASSQVQYPWKNGTVAYPSPLSEEQRDRESGLPKTPRYRAQTSDRNLTGNLGRRPTISVEGISRPSGRAIVLSSFRFESAVPGPSRHFALADDAKAFAARIIVRALLRPFAVTDRPL
jgi:hypothetical protein